jgi:hypothetical protein
MEEKGNADVAKLTYPSQLFQHSLVHAALLEVDTRTVDHIFDNLRVDRSNCLVRHFDRINSSRGQDACRWSRVG